jgi:hypothetical protein
MERQEILTRAAAWTEARGWKQKLAKHRGYDQAQPGSDWRPQ